MTEQGPVAGALALAGGRRTTRVARWVTFVVAVPVGAFAAALILYLATLAPSITLANGASDSGELASAAYTLGIAHPTGYPLYTLAGFVVTHLGRDEPARLLNIFSAVMGALCVGLVTLIGATAARRARPGANAPLVAAAVLGATAALALCPLFWTEATVTETRTFALALDAAVLALLVAPVRLGGRAAMAARALYGLALCDHLLSLYLAPAVALLVAPWAGQRARRWLLLAALFMLGLAPYLYLPLRAAANPVADWGHPATLGRVLWVVSGAEYRYLMGGPDAAALAARVGDLLGLIAAQVPWPTLAAAGLGEGALLAAAGTRRLGVALALTVVADVVLTGAYQASAAPAYLLLGLLCLSIAAAVGWLVAAVTLARLLARARLAAPSVAALTVAALLFTIAAGERGPAGDASRAVVLATSTATRDQAVTALRRLPRDATIFTTGDETSFPLWYAQRGLGVRPDVTIVATALLNFAWYDRQMRALPAFDPSKLPPADPTDDPTSDLGIGPLREAALATAAAPGHPVYLIAPSPALGGVCSQVFQPARGVYACVP